MFASADCPRSPRCVDPDSAHSCGGWRCSVLGRQPGGPASEVVGAGPVAGVMLREASLGPRCCS